MNLPELGIEITPANIDEYLSIFAVILDKLIDYKEQIQEAETEEDPETDSDIELIEPNKKICPTLLNPQDYQ